MPEVTFRPAASSRDNAGLYLLLRAYRANNTTQVSRRAPTGGKVDERYTSFADFYPFYLSEHSNRISRRLHFIGTLLVIVTAFYSLLSGRYLLLLLLPIIGYGFAWVGHFFFEKNKPATFIYPVYSLAGDFVMFKDILTGKIRF